MVQQIRALKDSLRQLRETVENCAATIVQLNAALDRLNAGELEIETPQSSNGVEIVADEYTTVVVQTVHGVRDSIRVPKR